jgi:hypothetical protein
LPHDFTLLYSFFEAPLNAFFETFPDAFFQAFFKVRHFAAFEFVEIGNDFLNFSFVDLPIAAIPAAEFQLIQCFPYFPGYAYVFIHQKCLPLSAVAGKDLPVAALLAAEFQLIDRFSYFSGMPMFSFS